jgi:hypothetical protein
MFERKNLQRDQIFVIFIAIGGLALIMLLGSLVLGSPGQSSGLLPNRGGIEGARVQTAREQALAAEAARWEAMAADSFNPYGSTAWVRGGLAPAQRVEAARLSGAAGETVNLYGSTGWVRGGLAPAQRVEAARLTGAAGETVNLYGSTAWVRAGMDSPQAIEAARLNGAAGEFVNLHGSTARVNADPQRRARLAEAARLTGLAIYYGQAPTEMSGELASSLGY